MSGKIHVSITEQPIDIAAAHDFVADPAHGAVSSFIGVVRRSNQGRDVVGISYDVFEPLASTILRQLCEKVRAAHGGEINISVTHFRGRLEAGGVSVVIAVSTPHRAESFEACRALIEEIKQCAPIWKQEHYADGDSGWIQGYALCRNL
ncbi:MAG: molybdenum cofactor biosynthesis protein MoaE [Pseudomonadota bacterium]